MLIYSDRQKQGIILHTFTLFLAIVTIQRLGYIPNNVIKQNSVQL